MSDTTLPLGFDYDQARRQYVELFGSSLVLNTYLKIALLGLAFVAVGLIGLNLHTAYTFRHWKPLIVRIDSVGRATALNYHDFEYTPQAGELKYFVTQFISKHFSRIRATVRHDYAESLYFLDGRLTEATIAANRRNPVIEKFLATPTEEIDIEVSNVALDDLREPPFRATVDYERVYYALADHVPLRRERYVGHLVFIVKALTDHVANALIPVNPLGLTITYLREDQAFR
jgi:type IV secretory pathway TrbF-like protein